MAPHHMLPQPPPLRPASNSSSIAAPDADQDSSHVLPNLPNLPNLPGMPGADVLAEQFKKFYSSSYYASLQQAAAVVAATANVANGGAGAAAAAAIDPMSTFADAEDDGEKLRMIRARLVYGSIFILVQSSFSKEVVMPKRFPLRARGYFNLTT